MEKIRVRPVDFDNEEEFAKIIKKACPPVKTSPLFKRHMAIELSLRIRQPHGYIPIWGKPAFWVGAGAVYAVALILVGLMLTHTANTPIYSHSMDSNSSSSSSNQQPVPSDDTNQPYSG